MCLVDNGDDLARQGWLILILIAKMMIVVMIRTPGVEREVLMMSNMRMTKVLKMTIVMAMMMPSKALGL